MIAETDAQPKKRLWVWALVAIVGLHAYFAFSYANVTPYRTAGYLFSQRDSKGGPAHVPDSGAPDERQHVNYVIELIEGRGLPTLRPMIPDPTDRNQVVRNPALIEEYEFHQPPLYYLLAAGYAKVVGLDSSDLRDPIRGKKLRLLSVGIGCLTILGVFCFAYASSSSRGVAITSAAVAAFLPMHGALNGAVSNDPLLFCLGTWFLVFLLGSLRWGWTARRSLAIALLLGAALLTKATALVFIPTLLVAIVLSKGDPARKKWGAMALGLGLLAALPWWVRSSIVYGDPLGLATFKEAFADALPASAWLESVGAISYWFEWVAWWTVRSFIGVFGYMDIFLNERGTSLTRWPEEPNLLYVALSACLFGFLLLGVRRIRLGDSQMKRCLGVGVLATALIALMFVQYNLTYFQGQGRYFYPVIGPISLVVGLGAWGHERLGRIAGCVFLVVLVLVNFHALRVLPEAFSARAKLAQANQTESLSPP